LGRQAHAPAIGTDRLDVDATHLPSGAYTVLVSGGDEQGIALRWMKNQR